MSRLAARSAREQRGMGEPLVFLDEKMTLLWSVVAICPEMGPCFAFFDDCGMW